MSLWRSNAFLLGLLAVLLFLPFAQPQIQTVQGAPGDVDIGTPVYIRDLDVYQNGPLAWTQYNAFYDEATGWYYVFYGDTTGNDLYYVSSDDNGTTWNSPVVVGSGDFEDYMYFIDVFYYENGTDSRVSYFRTDPCDAVGCGVYYYRTGTFASDGTITWGGAEDAVLNGDNAERQNYGPNVALDRDGYPWVCANQYKITDYYLNVRKGTNNDTSTWTDWTGFDGADGVVLKGPVAGGLFRSIIVPFRTMPGVAVIYSQAAAGLDARISKAGTATFQAEDQLTTMTLSANTGFSGVCDENDDIHVFYMSDANNSIMTSIYDNSSDIWRPARKLLDLGAGYFGNAFTAPHATINYNTSSIFIFWEYIPVAGAPQTRYLQYMERNGTTGIWGTNATAVTWDEDLWANGYGSMSIFEAFSPAGRNGIVFMSNEGLLGTPSIWLVQFDQEQAGAPAAPPVTPPTPTAQFPVYVPLFVRFGSFLIPLGWIAYEYSKIKDLKDGFRVFVVCLVAFILWAVLWYVAGALEEVIMQL